MKTKRKMQITCPYDLKKFNSPKSLAAHISKRHHSEGAYRPVVGTVQDAAGNLVSVTRLYRDGTLRTRTPFTSTKRTPPLVYRFIRL